MSTTVLKYADGTVEEPFKHSARIESAMTLRSHARAAGFLHLCQSNTAEPFPNSPQLSSPAPSCPDGTTTQPVAW